MLSPEQVVPFLQHDDPVLRNQARYYFRYSYDLAPLTAEHYWAVIDRLGENDEAINFAEGLKDLPQTEGSFQALLRALASRPSENFEYHYQLTARELDLGLVVHHRDELLNSPHLTAPVRAHLNLRLDLLDQAPAGAWERLMQHGRELAGRSAGRFDTSLSDALIEAASRGGSEICERAVEVLGGERSSDWRQMFAAGVVAAARYEPAIDALVQLLAVNGDLLRGEAKRALVRIGTPRVVESIVSFYPGKPWHVRADAHQPLARIKRPESVAGLLKVLEVELALAVDPSYSDDGGSLIDLVLIDLTELCSLAGLDESRRYIAESPEDADAMDMCESLLATATMAGVTLPDEAEWQKLLQEHKQRSERMRAGLNSLFGDFRTNQQKASPVFREFQNAAEDPPPQAFPVRVETIRNTAPKIGRNDPCSCGSGKKYKKCCGK